jgi:transglutaminase-like putative cysteine protease
MKHRRPRTVRFIVSAALIAAFASCAPSSDGERFIYSLSKDGRAFGYAEFTITRLEAGGRSIVEIKETGRGQTSALGAEIDGTTTSEYRLDAETWALISGETAVDQRTFKLRIAASVAGTTARISVDPGGPEKAIELGPGVVFENPVFFPHLLRDFGAGSADAKSYRILDLIDRTVRETVYTRSRTEAVEFASKSHPAIVLDSFTPDIGAKVRLWIDAESGQLLKLETPRFVAALADRTARRGYGRASLDDRILAKAGVRIEDIPAIAYLKVRGSLAPEGSRITVEGLNIPGQTFEGKVEDNAIEGVFEIRQPKYDGRGAPPYPPRFGDRPGLLPYLGPEDFIESDDPVLVAKAGEIAAGSADSWEAVRRLSLWVSDNIGYDIPGGATARNTYDVREGECGAHSRLMTAFCRAVGIPSRVVWGCMYSSSLDGSFGQHAWNEVYMGEAGWIPLDTTARETDFLDSGHIRLGVLSSAHIAWNPKSLSVLDFEAGRQKFGVSPEPSVPERYEPYLGVYNGSRGRITVFARDGGLALKLADGRTFGLRDPDESGRWLFSVTPDVDVTFESAGSGPASALTLTNRVRLPKKDGPQEAESGVPPDARPFLGRYSVPMEKRDIAVVHRGGGLAVIYPGGRVLALEGPDADGRWSAGSGGDRFSFIRVESGAVEAMVLHEIIRSPRAK